MTKPRLDMRFMMTLALCATMLAAAAPASAAAPRAAAPVDVAIRTSLGTIVVRLDPAHAPGTTANFLHFVDTGAYNGSTFYRTVTPSMGKIAIIQGGLNPQGPSPNLHPIRLEPTNKTGLHNTDGTIAMARTNDPDSATTEFFLSLGDNRFLDAGGPTGPGYAVFGKMIRGADVARKIQRSHADGQLLAPPIRIVTIARVR